MYKELSIHSAHFIAGNRFVVCYDNAFKLNFKSMYKKSFRLKNDW